MFATLDDVIPEPLEIFSLLLQSQDPTVVIGDVSQSEIRISANDDAWGVFSLKVSSQDCLHLILYTPYAQTVLVGNYVELTFNMVQSLSNIPLAP